MTEIRLYAFLYSIWTTVICHPDRKADFCLGFLLEKEVFERTFNHWCPMVRAYYMRILCWRVGRYDGEASEGDTLILETLHQRLRSVWSSFMWQREQAELRHALPPSTAPGHPAPGRRLLIVRTDTQVPPNSFLSFDGILPTPSAPVESLAWKRNSTLSQVIEMDTRPSSSASNDFGLEEKEQETGLKGFLRNMMGTSKNRSKSRSNTSRLGSRASTASSLDDFSPIPSSTSALTRTPTLVRSATDDNRVPRARASAAREPNTPSEVQAPTHRNFSFKFSLEFHPKLQANPPGNMRLYPPRLPMPAQLFLQSQPGKTNLAGQTPMRGVQPVGADKSRSKYAGRALAEWTVVVGECQGFFERRKGEGVPGNKFVETPTLGVEVFRRPG
ncbi:hypothetical protein H2203_000769 [Taxawa tesnikishii (nom. ined.)]|nr:hypothetical protein H2203_000769 [Dothideales sp. JES 119]